MCRIPHGSAVTVQGGSRLHMCGDRLGDLRQTITATVCDTEFGADSEASNVWARVEGLRLGCVDIFRYEGRGVQRGWRSVGHVRANPVDDYVLLLPLNAPVEVTQSGHCCVIEPGNFTILSTHQPYEVKCGVGRGNVYSELFLRVAGPLLRQHLPLLDRCCALPMSMQAGAGKIMRSLIETTFAAGASSQASALLGGMLVNSIGAASIDAAEIYLSEQGYAVNPHWRLRMRALRFIESQLSNPGLHADVVAAHCGVSLRALHQAFSESDKTVAGCIRELRLLRCQADLRNPFLHNRSVIEIAVKWGYSAPSSFTRAYRAHFGRTPREERQAGS